MKENKNLAYNLLFVCPDTGKELSLIAPPEITEDGEYILTVSNKDSPKSTWKHIIKTYEI